MDQDRRRRAAAPATGSAIVAAWRAGTLLSTGPARQASPSAQARAHLQGTGESYAAWLLDPGDGPALTVRVAVRAPDAMARPMGLEAAALPHLPPGSGPRLVGWCEADGADSPIGLPYLVTSHQPGAVLAPDRWRPAHLRAHVRGLARLQRDRWPGRGPFVPGSDPLAELRPGPLSIVDEFDRAIDRWHRTSPQLWRAPGTPELVASARACCLAADPVFAGSGEFTFAHGDLCATNVLWDPRPDATGPEPHYIDFEWAQVDDPARDLAIIAGPVHGGPWYVPLDEAGVDRVLDDYVAEVCRLDPTRRPDRTALRVRRDAWEAYEKTAMLLYVRHRAAEGVAGFAAIADQLASSLGAVLAARGHPPHL